MTYVWTCPYCDGKEYSSYSHKETEITKCSYCDKEYPNPYYEGEKRSADDGRE